MKIETADNSEKIELAVWKGENMYFHFLRGEYWWGGIVNLGETMPYSEESDVLLDLSSIKLSLDQSAPAFVSSKGRYLWSEKPFRIAFWHGEIRIDTEYEIELNEEGSCLQDACCNLAKNHYHLSGNIPKEIFFTKPQYNAYIEAALYHHNAISMEEQILEYAEGIVNCGLPTGVLMIDAGWQQYFGEWKFNEDRFPHAKEMVKQLHDMGFTVMLWVMLILDENCPDYEWLKKENLLLRDCEGQIAKRWFWGGKNAVLDLTNPHAVEWFKQQLSHLQKEYAVDGFKFDGGDAYFYDGEDLIFQPCIAQEQTAVYEALGLDYPFHEFRCGWKGAGIPLVHRLQDKLHTWEGQGLCQIIPHSLLQGLIGNYYHCPDMVGGGVPDENICDYFDEELYMRWLEASLFCPMIQFSLAPWRVLSEKNFTAVKKLCEVRQSKAEYFLELAYEAAKTGNPIMRCMAYECPEEGLEKITDQFMAGSRLLVAPVLEKGKRTRTVFLPEGKWISDDGIFYEGGEEITITVPLDRLPYFERCNE